MASRNKDKFELTVSKLDYQNTHVIFCCFNVDCEKEIKSLMWIYVLVGNLIRGIGDTPIVPLVISYIEDFAKSENSPLYIGKFENQTWDHF